MDQVQTPLALDRSRISWKAFISALRSARPGSKGSRRKHKPRRPRLSSENPKEKSVIQVVEVPQSSVPEPNTQRALVVASKGKYELRNDYPVPSVGQGEVMIRICYVGLNPIDWKSVEYSFCLPDFPWVSHLLSLVIVG